MHCSPSSGSRATLAVIRPSTGSPRPDSPTAYAPVQSIDAQTTSESHLTRNPCRRDEPVASGDGAGMEAEAGPVLAHAADEALGELRRAEGPDAFACRLRLGRCRRGGGVERRIAGRGLGDEQLTVEEEQPVALAPDRERALERRGQMERHLSRGAETRAEEAGRVAAVR